MLLGSAGIQVLPRQHSRLAFKLLRNLTFFDVGISEAATSKSRGNSSNNPGSPCCMNFGEMPPRIAISNAWQDLCEGH
jgi:hypothetical protein